MELHRLQTRKVPCPDCLDGLRKEVDLALEESDASQNEEAITRIVLVARLVKVEQVHAAAVQTRTARPCGQAVA